MLLLQFSLSAHRWRETRLRPASRVSTLQDPGRKQRRRLFLSPLPDCDGDMPLHLQQHKSYHPYSRDNVERVRRDEEEARVEALERRERARRAEAEARIELLRSRAGGRGAVAAEAAAAPDAPLEAAASASRHGKRKTVSTLHDEIGHAAPSSADHVNFWADEEKSASSSQNKRPRSSGRESLRSSSSSQPGPRDPSRRSGTSSSAMQGNADFEAEQRAEKKRFEDQVTMFLGKPAKELDPWYQNGDLKSGAERKKTQEQRLEEACVAGGQGTRD